MDNDNVAIRLKGFIDSEGLSHSQFADKCGIPKPSLSQLLSGRNKKVSDVIIGQIHRAFPDLSVLWLLFGEGGMRTAVSSRSTEQDTASESEDSFRAARFGHASCECSGSGDSFADEEVAGSGRLPENDSDNVFSGFKDAGIAGDCPDVRNYSNLRALNTPSKALQIAEKQLLDAENKIAELQMQIDKMRQNPRKVTHITVYYDDSTFETFYSKS
ncbi:MAG: helix-turn-helix domain-containing protein [Muribaculaceae bacterium]|nr:helix-turn-helix domain-containing protein [Muribaculaceae bacterium]